MIYPILTILKEIAIFDAMKLDILCFAAHPDDVELACSGTILRHIDQGYKVGVIDLTQGELGTRGTPELRHQEAQNASKILGIQVRENLKLEDGFFRKDKETLLKIIQKIRQYQPTIILCNAEYDRHVDHGRASDIVEEAAFLSGLRKIETTENGVLQSVWRPQAVYHYIQDRLMKADVVVDITPYFEKKLEAIRAFKSQFYDPESNEPETPISVNYFFDIVKAHATDFGRMIQVQYGEAFTVRRPIGSNDLTQLM